MKKLINIVVLGAIAFNFSGCMGENVSCSGEVEKSLVEEIVLPESKVNMIADFLNEKEPAKGMLYLAMRKMAAAYGSDESKLNKEFKFLTEATAEVEKEYSKYLFKLENIRTVSKNKELNSVSCVGEITIDTLNYSSTYDVEYNAQLGDDKKNVFVEVSSFE